MQMNVDPGPALDHQQQDQDLDQQVLVLSHVLFQEVDQGPGQMVLDLGLPLLDHLDHVLDLQDLDQGLPNPGLHRDLYQDQDPSPDPDQALAQVLDQKNPDHALAVLEVTVKTTLARPRNVLSKRHLVVIMRTKATTTVMWKTLPRKKGNELL